jgi:cellobiose-specific phosphotransferase system component IIA
MNEEERQAKQARLAKCKAWAEKAYDDMYEAHSFSQANALYSDAKEGFYDAIKLADELDMANEADALRKRLEHIKRVFRSQFAT